MANHKIFDVMVVGGGPAGMATAINAEAEGLSTIIVEGGPRFGGRVEPSHAIENYLGFLSISGRELALKGMEQMDKFGVTRIKGRTVEKLGCNSTHKLLQMSDGQTAVGCAVVVATGMRHKTVDIPGIDLWGVFYNTEPIEVSKWAGRKVVIVGGENSASQAALNFANNGADVVMVLNGEELRMSAYLQPILKDHPNIKFEIGSLAKIEGDKHCQSMMLNHGYHFDCDAVVIFSGAEPLTGWLKGMVELDDKGFITTSSRFESSLDNVYAVGDVRSGSVKRVASAVGEGTSVVRYIMMRKQGR